MLTKYYDAVLQPFDSLDAWNILANLYGPSWNLNAKTNSSSCRVNTTDEDLELSLDLPGVRSEDLSVQVTGRLVNINGKVRGKDFKHSYRLSKEYDTTTPSATLENGVLSLKFNRCKEDVKTITIKVK